MTPKREPGTQATTPAAAKAPPKKVIVTFKIGPMHDLRALKQLLHGIQMEGSVRFYPSAKLRMVAGPALDRVRGQLGRYGSFVKS